MVGLTKIRVGITDFPGSSGLFGGSYIDQDTLFTGSQTAYNIPTWRGRVGASAVYLDAQTININTSTYWDVSSYATPANRAGKDFYCYALQSGGFILSANSTYPTGYTANTSRKISGFHCLCVSVGSIAGHTLTGYVAGDILPLSVWDRFNRSSATQEGRVKSRCGKWVMIYLPSVSGSTLVSVNGGTIADGSSYPAFHAYKFEQWFARQGEMPISQIEFFAVSDGANQGTVLSYDPGTTGGHTDSLNRRMISNEGVEDTCGVMEQWSRDLGAYKTSDAYSNAYDAYDDSSIRGQHYGAPYRGLLGGSWGTTDVAGTRSSYWDAIQLNRYPWRSSRGVAEPAVSRF